MMRFFYYNYSINTLVTDYGKQLYVFCGFVNIYVKLAWMKGIKVELIILLFFGSYYQLNH